VDDALGRLERVKVMHPHTLEQYLLTLNRGVIRKRMKLLA
jgi:hypothetical protein